MPSLMAMVFFETAGTPHISIVRRELMESAGDRLGHGVSCDFVRCVAFFLPGELKSFRANVDFGIHSLALKGDELGAGRLVRSCTQFEGSFPHSRLANAR